jgi:hypothetical protein
VRRPFGLEQGALSERHDSAANRDWNRLVGIPRRIFVRAYCDFDDAVAEEALASDRGKARLRICGLGVQTELTSDQMGRIVDDTKVDLDAPGLADDDLGDRADVHTCHADGVALLQAADVGENGVVGRLRREHVFLRADRKGNARADHQRDQYENANAKASTGGRLHLLPNPATYPALLSRVSVSSSTGALPSMKSRT